MSSPTDLANYASAAVSAAVVGKTAGDATQLQYTTATYSPPSYVRNPSLFCAANLTGIAAATDEGNGKHGGVLLDTPGRDIIVFADHYAANMVRFIASDGTVIDRAVADYRIIYAADGGNSDIRICRLASSVPATITPLKIMPSGWGTKFPVYKALCLWINQFKRLSVAQWSGPSPLSTGGHQVWVQTYLAPTDADVSAWGTDVIDFDSGSPFFFLFGSTPVLLSCVWQTGGPGPDVSYYQNAINAAISELGSAGRVATFSMPTEIQTFSIAGSTTVTFPANIDLTQPVLCECWGAGGGSGARANAEGGGGGGGYGSKDIKSLITAGGTYAVVVGAPGVHANVSDGGDSYFGDGTQVKGGHGEGASNGVGGSGGGSDVGFNDNLGTVTHNGGDGANVSVNTGGGGGGSATALANGTNASAPTAGTGQGSGGTGGLNGQAGTNGTSPGGGAGGGGAGGDGGFGADGRVAFTYSLIPAAAANDSSLSLGLSLGL